MRPAEYHSSPHWTMLLPARLMSRPAWCLRHFQATRLATSKLPLSSLGTMDEWMAVTSSRLQPQSAWCCTAFLTAPTEGAAIEEKPPPTPPGPSDAGAAESSALGGGFSREPCTPPMG